MNAQNLKNLSLLNHKSDGRRNDAPVLSGTEESTRGNNFSRLPLESFIPKLICSLKTVGHVPSQIKNSKQTNLFTTKPIFRQICRKHMLNNGKPVTEMDEASLFSSTYSASKRQAVKDSFASTEMKKLKRSSQPPRITNERPGQTASCNASMAGNPSRKLLEPKAILDWETKDPIFIDLNWFKRKPASKKQTSPSKPILLKNNPNLFSRKDTLYSTNQIERSTGRSSQHQNSPEKKVRFSPNLVVFMNNERHPELIAEHKQVSFCNQKDLPLKKTTIFIRKPTSRQAL